MLAHLVRVDQVLLLARDWVYETGATKTIRIPVRETTAAQHEQLKNQAVRLL